MTKRRTDERARTLLAAVTRPQRTTGGLEVETLLEAWGFVRGGRVDGDEPERVTFWIHPEHPHLHMTVPIAGPVARRVVEYAAELIRSIEET